MAAVGPTDKRRARGRRQQSPSRDTFVWRDPQFVWPDPEYVCPDAAALGAHFSRIVREVNTDVRAANGVYGLLDKIPRKMRRQKGALVLHPRDLAWWSRFTFADVLSGVYAHGERVFTWLPVDAMETAGLMEGAAAVRRTWDTMFVYVMMSPLRCHADATSRTAGGEMSVFHGAVPRDKAEWRRSPAPPRHDGPARASDEAARHVAAPAPDVTSRAPSPPPPPPQPPLPGPGPAPARTVAPDGDADGDGDGDGDDPEAIRAIAELLTWPDRQYRCPDEDAVHAQFTRITDEADRVPRAAKGVYLVFKSVRAEATSAPGALVMLPHDLAWWSQFSFADVAVGGRYDDGTPLALWLTLRRLRAVGLGAHVKRVRKTWSARICYILLSPQGENVAGTHMTMLSRIASVSRPSAMERTNRELIGAGPSAVISSALGRVLRDTPEATLVDYGSPVARAALRVALRAELEKTQLSGDGSADADTAAALERLAEVSDAEAEEAEGTSSDGRDGPAPMPAPAPASAPASAPAPRRTVEAAHLTEEDRKLMEDLKRLQAEPSPDPRAVAALPLRAALQRLQRLRDVASGVEQAQAQAETGVTAPVPAPAPAPVVTGPAPATEPPAPDAQPDSRTRYEPMTTWSRHPDGVRRCETWFLPVVQRDREESTTQRQCRNPACGRVLPSSGPGKGKLCGGCRMPRYCDARCQAADWPRHKIDCLTIERGRAAFVQCGNEECGRVLRTAPGMKNRGKKCATCMRVSYCNEACQRAAWPAHREVCAAPAATVAAPS
jgi:hypothetical protein